jgi:uncharacterized metal-binding protein YceD (DUF177 family)
MKVHLLQIPKGDTLHLEGEEDSSALELELAGAETIGPLHYSLDVGLSGGGLFVTGRLRQRVRMTCVSCLDSFEAEIISNPFAIQLELSGSESVDLTPEVREDMHLLLPAHPRCDQGGEKTCPARYPVAAPAFPLQGERMRPAVWAALDKLNTPPSLNTPPPDGSP